MKAGSMIITVLSGLVIVGVGYFVYRNYFSLNSRDQAVKYLALNLGIKPENFKTFGDEYLIERAKAMKAKEPFFVLKNDTRHFATDTGKVITT